VAAFGAPSIPAFFDVADRASNASHDSTATPN
jgi:hypothetical protein